MTGRGHCSCGAEIVWIRTPAGADLAIDPEPHPEGTVALAGDRRRGGVIPKVARPNFVAWGTPLYLAHWAKCPDADAHRRQAAERNRRR